MRIRLHTGCNRPNGQNIRPYAKGWPSAWRSGAFQAVGEERKGRLPEFQPVTKQEMKALGWDAADFILVTGDAYVDHPSFGAAIIARVLEAEGHRVAVLAQPDFHSAEAFRALGQPKFGFLVTSGNIDSMVAHYTVARRKRTQDVYSPGGKAGLRPDRAAIVYTNRLREAYPGCAVVLGGLEASLRRFAHYDYWEDRVRSSVLLDSGADLLIYGMGERAVREVAARLAAGEPVSALTDVRGTCYMARKGDVRAAVFCPSLEQVRVDPRAYALATRLQYDNQDFVIGKPVVQPHGERLLVQNPPAAPLSREELDTVYSLPYTRRAHPMYDDAGSVPGLEEVRFSITHNRGCFGACNFCSIAFHQSRFVTSRSERSVVDEAKGFTRDPLFKGYISDVGGPTANFRAPSCEKQKTAGLCRGKKCLAPGPCPALKASHAEYVHLLRTLRAVPKIKRVFVRSGIRFDYVMADPDDAFLRELVEHHVSGQLRVAPEHCVPEVLDRMGKPHIEPYLAFEKRFYSLTKQAGREQYLVPYLMSSHPGSTLRDAVELALFCKRERIRPEDVQDFYPTPGTLSTCMYYTGLDPYTMKPVYVPKSPHEKALQRALLQYFVPKNRPLVAEALEKAGRADLIGQGPGCLIPPVPGHPGHVPEPTARTAGSGGCPAKRGVRRPERSFPRKGNRPSGRRGPRG